MKNEMKERKRKNERKRLREREKSAGLYREANRGAKRKAPKT